MVHQVLLVLTTQPPLLLMLWSGIRGLGILTTGNNTIKGVDMKTRKTFFLSFSFLLLGLVPISAMGQSLPHTFSANTAAKASEVNSNFSHLANQFMYNSKTINCTSDNITQAILDGYNMLIVNGACTISTGIIAGNQHMATLNKTYAGESWFTTPGPENAAPMRIVLIGGTGKNTDSITNQSNNLSLGSYNGGNIWVEGLTINGKVETRFNSQVTFYNSKITGRVRTHYNSNIWVNYTNIDVSSSGECFDVENSSSLKADNMTLTGCANVRFSSSFETNESSSVSGQITVEYNSNAQLNYTTLSSSGNSILNKYNSSVIVNNTTFSNSGGILCSTGAVYDNDSDSNPASTSGC